VVITAVASLSGGFHSDCNSLGCSIFTITLGEKILFGNNEDFYLDGTFIKFVPSAGAYHGYVTLGYHNNGHEYDGYAMGGMNDQGLCFDSNGLPAVPLDPKPGQPMAAFHLMESVLYRFASVSEVIEWANTSTWYLDMLASQLHIADANGDVVVISAGTDGQVTFTYMGESHFIVSTNYNLANPDNHIPGCYPCWRYDTAVQMLEDVTSEELLTIAACRDVLDAIHQEGTNPTRYSNVFDLKQRSIYLWHNHNYSTVLEFSLDEELTSGYHIWTIADLFASPTSSTSETVTETTTTTQITTPTTTRISTSTTTPLTDDTSMLLVYIGTLAVLGICVSVLALRRRVM
jgi:hypothetical protein